MIIRKLVVVAATLAAAAFACPAVAQPSNPPWPPPPTSPGESSPTPDTAPVPASAAPASSTPVGDVGESCRARSDCAADLKCVDSRCNDDAEGTACGARADCGGRLACIDGTCVPPGSGSGTSGDSVWDAPPFQGVKGMVGATLGGGPNVFLLDGVFGSTSETSGGLLFALKGGVMIDRIEVGLELAPVTVAYDFDLDPAFLVDAYAGYHIPITDRVAWPIRGGLGMAAVVSGGSPLFVARADLIGVSFEYGPLLIDFHAPSFRFATEFDGLNVFSFMFGVGGAFLPG